MERDIYKYYQTGFCKFKTACTKFHENELFQVKYCSQIQCTKCHPKECRYFAQYKYCKFRACAFAHNEKIEHGDVKASRDCINYMRQEISILKLKLNSLATIRQESESLRSAINIMKEDIIEIKTMNKVTESKLKYLKEEIEVESEDDADNNQDYTWLNKYDRLYPHNYCDIQIRERTNFKAHMKSHMQKELAEEIKCFKCE